MQELEEHFDPGATGSVQADGPTAGDLSMAASDGVSASHPEGPPGTALTDSPGLAILVTCDYKENGALTELLGTREDARQMMKTFNRLNYTTCQLLNPTKTDMKALVKEVSNELATYNMDEREGREKVIIFAFSGHGCSKEEIEHLYTNDGETLQFTDEIVFPLTRHMGVKHVPKLFFIDACRGGEILTKGAAAAPDNQVAKSGKVYFEKGVQHVVGNYHIAYATIPHHVSYMDSSGSRWMPKLARALRNRNDSYQNIVSSVMAQVNREVCGGKQQCESIDRLNTGPLYLKKRGKISCRTS
jgi:hypothetical protein